MTKRYFSHPVFGNHPVVGVSWKQATAFGEWRTHYLNSVPRKQEAPESDFRLPTEAQWGGARVAVVHNQCSPGVTTTSAQKGCLMANFKPGRGNYPVLHCTGWCIPAEWLWSVLHERVTWLSGLLPSTTKAATTSSMIWTRRSLEC